MDSLINALRALVTKTFFFFFYNNEGIKPIFFSYYKDGEVGSKIPIGHHIKILLNET